MLRAVRSEMQIERALVAQEMQQSCVALRQGLAAELPGVKIGELSHESLKVLTCRAAAIV